MTLNDFNLNNTEKTTPYCNFITPPDRAPEALPSVLLVDSDWNEIEEIALWYKNSNSELYYNVFLYQDSMWEPEWLKEIFDSVDAVIVNTADSAITDVKMRFIKDSRTWYYGPVKFKGSEQQLERPLDWFIKHDK